MDKKLNILQEVIQHNTYIISSKHSFDFLAQTLFKIQELNDTREMCWNWPILFLEIQRVDQRRSRLGSTQLDCSAI